MSGYERVRRDLLLAVRPDLFSNIAGSTDSELMFHLALTFGLIDDPIAGLARMAGFVEVTAAVAGVCGPVLQMTIGVSDGARAVVSEPPAALPGLWREVPAGSALIIGDDVREDAFAPVPV